MFVKDGAMINQKHEKENVGWKKVGKRERGKRLYPNRSGNSACMLREEKKTREEIWKR